MASKHLRPGRFILLGALLGLTYAYTRPVRSVAEITLFFPSDISRPQLHWHGDEEEEPQDANETRPNSRNRVREILSDKKTIDELCSQFEAAGTPLRSTLLREGCLLLDQNNLRLEPVGDHSLRVQVWSGDSQVAEELCRGVLRCLKDRTQKELAEKQAPRTQEKQKLESLMLFQEKLLFKRLWDDFSRDDTELGVADAMQRLELSEYEGSLERFHQMVHGQFYQNVEDAMQAPGFAVTEPLSVRQQSPAWQRWVGLGASAGLALWVGLKLLWGKGPSASKPKAAW